jgi:xanthine phosphoribosyltransferase
MVKRYYSYEELVVDCKALCSRLDETYDALLVVARGGMSFAHLLSQKLDIRDISLISLASYDDTIQRDSVTIKEMPNLDSNKRYLIVEDIVDSGKSMDALTDALTQEYPKLNYDVASLFYKKTASYRPKYYIHEAKEWIEFFWEVDL